MLVVMVWLSSLTSNSRELVNCYIWTGDGVLFHMQPGKSFSLTQQKFQTASHGEWLDHCSPVFLTLYLSILSALPAMVFPQESHLQNGSSGQIPPLILYPQWSQWDWEDELAVCMLRVQGQVWGNTTRNPQFAHLRRTKPLRSRSPAEYPCHSSLFFHSSLPDGIAWEALSGVLGAITSISLSLGFFLYTEEFASGP